MSRMTVLFTLLPFLGQGFIPPMVRQALVFAFSLLLMPMVFRILPDQDMSTFESTALIMKEVFLGVMMAFFLAMPFWIADSSGFFIDNQRGLSMAATFDPMTGNNTTPLGMTFVRVLIAYFFSAGGFLAMISLVYESYGLWPIFSFFPKIDGELAQYTMENMDYMMKLVVMLAAPISITMFLSDFGLGLVNRFAPQLNVFVLSMAVKSGLASFLILFYLTTLFGFLRDETFHALQVVRFLSNVFE